MSCDKELFKKKKLNLRATDDSGVVGGGEITTARLPVLSGLGIYISIQ